MSKTRQNVPKSKRGGYDYWSRRCFGSGCMGVGPVAKFITKMKERTRNKRIIQQAYIDPDNVEGRFPGE